MNLLVTNDRRVLAAVRFRDPATGSFVGSGLEVQAELGRWILNRSGDWVLASAPGLEGHRFAFDAPPELPAERSVTVRAVVHDRRGRYLSRGFSIEVPRLPGDGSANLFDPIVVDLPSSPNQALRPAWAAARISVRTPPSEAWPQGMPVEGALVRLHRSGHGELCRGLTDHRGEALVISPRLPLFAAGASSVFDPSVRHSVRVIADLDAIDPSTGRRGAIADPDQLWADRSGLSDRTRSFDLSPGESVSREVELVPA
ncbi:MAG: hypothetical protein H6741_02320 [Alphaproteobacteria bacterium]|nr:hypothetical protein [Alphaproteobacteria bacterium]MCB9791539.1 hypothetical protein [Alphaproteobacteria bacterium]